MARDKYVHRLHGWALNATEPDTDATVHAVPMRAVETINAKDLLIERKD
jgi:hypothetical protein